MIGGGVVLLFFGGEALAFIEDDLLLAGFALAACAASGSA